MEQGWGRRRREALTLSRPCGHRGAALPFLNLPSPPHLVLASGDRGWVGALCQAQARVLTVHFPLLHLLAVWLWVTYSTSVSPSVKWACGIPFLGGFGNE